MFPGCSLFFWHKDGLYEFNGCFLFFGSNLGHNDISLHFAEVEPGLEVAVEHDEFINKNYKFTQSNNYLVIKFIIN